MNGVSGKSWLVANVLLTLLLITAQTGALAHAYQHDPGFPQDTTCASCVTANQLLSACVDNCSIADIESYSSCLNVEQVFLSESTLALVVRQRGPPTLL